MPWFKIYAGLSGGFGGAKYQGTYEYNEVGEASYDAYRLAEEEYQSYEGYHGILDYEQCREDLYDSGFIDDDMTDDEIADMIYNHYLGEMESWIDYYVVQASGPDDIDD